MDSNSKSIIHKAGIIWLYGRPCSGKTTIGNELITLFDKFELPALHIDGDELRGGLNNDLGFNSNDRFENIRRAAEMASFLAVKKTLTVICTFVTPFIELRLLAKTIAQRNKVSFFEIYIDAPLEICIQRDVKGQYKFALAGQITEFTGITSPFEVPQDEFIAIDSVNQSPEECAMQIFRMVNDESLLKIPLL
jgi:adenylyl-sulfate kinase